MDELKHVPQVCIWTPKGGVAKTTNTLALAYSLAIEHRMRVLVYDCDAQHNLSDLAMGDLFEKEPFDGDLDAFVNRPGPQQPRTFYDQLKMQQSDYSKVFPALATLVPNTTSNILGHHGGVYIVAGHRKMGDFDTMLQAAEIFAITTQISPGFKQFLHSPKLSIQATAKHYNADIVLIDASPSSNTLNFLLIMSSDYLIMPILADAASRLALKDAKERLTEEWPTRWEKIQTALGNPINHVTILGFIMSRTPDDVDAKAGGGYVTVEESTQHQPNKWKEAIQQEAMIIWQTLGARPDQPLPMLEIPQVDELMRLAEECHLPVNMLRPQDIKLTFKLSSDITKFKKEFNAGVINLFRPLMVGRVL